MAVTDDFYIDNQPGAPFRAELNTILAALATANAGSTEPPNPQPGIMWLDTSSSPWALKRRNDKNTGWIKMYDTSNKPTKAEIGLGNVPNYPATSSLTDGSSNKLSTAKAAKSLEDKKLDKTAKAADSSKLGGVEAGKFAKQTGSYSGLRARATTKGDVGLGNVANYTVSSSITLNSNTSYALSSTVYTLNQNKLGKTSQAVDSAKLGGKLPTAFAPSVHSHSADNLPTGTTSSKGVLQILDSVTSTSRGYAAAPKSVKTAYDWANAAHSLASTANNRANAAMPKAGGNLNGTLNYTPDTGDIIQLDGKTVLRRISPRGGISFGADDALIIGSGESRSTLQSNVSATDEVTHIGADGSIKLYTNLQRGWGSRKVFEMQYDGGFKPANAAKTRTNLGLKEIVLKNIGVNNANDIPTTGQTFLAITSSNTDDVNNYSTGLNPKLCYSTAPNSPPVSGVFHYITTYAYSNSGNKTQIAVPYNGTSSIWIRYKYNNSWSQWKELAFTASLLLKPTTKTFLSVSKAGRTCELPAGGTWSYCLNGINRHNGQWSGGSNAGVSAGGTIVAVSGGNGIRGFIWKIA